MTSFRGLRQQLQHMREARHAAAMKQPPHVEFLFNVATNRVVLKISHASLNGGITLELAPELAENFEQQIAKTRAALAAKRAELEAAAYTPPTDGSVVG